MEVLEEGVNLKAWKGWPNQHYHKAREERPTNRASSVTVFLFGVFFCSHLNFLLF